MHHPRFLQKEKQQAMRYLQYSLRQTLLNLSLLIQGEDQK